MLFLFVKIFQTSLNYTILVWHIQIHFSECNYPCNQVITIQGVGVKNDNIFLLNQARVSIC